ncbi:MAG TPA: S9 family peptidase [Anaerolineales bacterium]|nr:S9 family peptidase [Anaerolineales bacterium]
MLRELDTRGKYERGGWPAQPRPDVKPPDGWGLALVTSVGRPRSHSPSPEGDRIAFVWDISDASDIFLLPLAGGWPQRITPDRGPKPYWLDEAPRWSPDGKTLVFTDKGHVWLVDVGGGLPTKITSFTTRAGSPRWMPDGHHILVTVERDERARILMTDRTGAWPRPVSSGPGDDSDPEVSPDARFVAYLHHPDDDLDRTDIMLSEIEGGIVGPVTHTPGNENSAPDWSPDSQRIAYTSERPGFFELFIFEVEGGREHQVTHLGHDIDDYVWAPEGDRLAVTVNRCGSVDLAILRLETAEVEYLRGGAGVHSSPHWLKDSRTITFEYEDPLHPPDIFAIDVESKKTTQLTFSAPPALTALDLVKPELVAYRSFDDLEIPSVLYRPRIPNGAAIVYPHGGPTSQYLLEWDIWAQYMVAKGYTWFAPNFRGSTGFGKAFERANYTSWGVDDTRDILAAADYLAALDGIDPNRLAVYGASYGSYLVMSALASDPKHRFACGVAKYGDCNILTSWAQGDRESRVELERMMGHPADSRDRYWVGSPVKQVANIDRPLMIFHGLLDPIVHPLQSEELVEALKNEGKTYEYKTYSDEGHGLLRRKNQLDFYANMERFIDWYLL